MATGTQLGKGGPTSANQAFVADPVNTANGNYAYQHTDIAIPTRGLPLDFARAYNSLSPQAGPLGYGWTHNWNLRLTENTTDGSVTITFGDGHTERGPGPARPTTAGRACSASWSRTATAPST